MNTIPHTQGPLDEDALYGWYRIRDGVMMEVEAPSLEVWQNFDAVHVDAPETSLHIADPMTKNEIMMMYKCCKSIRESIDNFVAMVQRRKGTFPLPGWHKWMIASGFLEACNNQWKKLEDPQNKQEYEEWYELVYKPRPGNQISGYLQLGVSKRVPTIKITSEDDMEEEDSEENCERPKKLRK